MHRSGHGRRTHSTVADSREISATPVPRRRVGRVESGELVQAPGNRRNARRRRNRATPIFEVEESREIDVKPAPAEKACEMRPAEGRHLECIEFGV